MKNNLPLPKEKKLTVIHRVEPGCLGPNGNEHIVKFCEFAQRKIISIDSDFIDWIIEPRLDKSLAETQFQIVNKQLSYAKANLYLQVFNKDIDVFEEHFNDALMHLIEEFLGRC